MSDNTKPAPVPDDRVREDQITFWRDFFATVPGPKGTVTTKEQAHEIGALLTELLTARRQLRDIEDAEARLDADHEKRIEAWRASATRVVHGHAKNDCYVTAKHDIDEALALMRSAPTPSARDDGEVERLRQELKEALLAEQNERDLNAALRKHHEQERDTLRADLEARTRERDELHAFKAYVHQRLDDAGVPANPQPPKHALAGCRIGDRLDVALDGYMPRGASAAPGSAAQATAHPAAELRGLRDEVYAELQGVDGVRAGSGAANNYSRGRADGLAFAMRGINARIDRLPALASESAPGGERCQSRHTDATYGTVQCQGKVGHAGEHECEGGGVTLGWVDDESEWPECSGNPASCPENEGHGCCKPNPPQPAREPGAKAALPVPRVVWQGKLGAPQQEHRIVFAHEARSQSIAADYRIEMAVLDGMGAKSWQTNDRKDWIELAIGEALSLLPEFRDAERDAAARGEAK